MSSNPTTRTLFVADATFEAILGAVLLIGTGAAWFTETDFTVPTSVVIGVGGAFLLASASQLFYFINSPRRVLLELAVGNAAMAIAALVWLLISRRFSTAGTTILAIAIVWKLAIGSIQVLSLTTGPAARAQLIDDG